MRAIWRVLVVAVGAAGIPALPALAQTPAGPEFRVNVDLLGQASFPSVAIDGAGNSVVAWQASSQVRARRFDAAGAPRGTEFVVHASPAAASAPAVLSAASGAFTVVWYSAANGGTLVARRYDAAGAALGAEFRVDTTGAVQARAAAAADAAGDFVAAWTRIGGDGDGPGIFAQRFDAGGNPLGGEFRVNAYTTGDQSRAAVAVDGAGNFVVVWRSAPAGSDPAVIAGQRFDRDGIPVGAEFQVSSAGRHDSPSVAASPTGEFLVVWADNTHARVKIRARRYDAAGVPGPERPVHTTAISGVGDTAVASDGAGRYVAVWMDSDPSVGFKTKGRRLDAAGAPRGRTFRVSNQNGPSAFGADIAADTHGNLLVAWESSVSNDDDVHAQRYRALTPHALEVDPVAGTGSDGNGVLEPGETVDLRTAWQNHSGSALALAGDLAQFAGPWWLIHPVIDGAGGYGVVPDAGVQACVDCYRVSLLVPPQRPGLHWDALATEVLNNDDEGHADWLVHIGASFVDVPRATPFYRFVETLLHGGVTAGCGPDTYCPASPVTREQMAVFVLLASDGKDYQPRSCNAAPYGDVPASSPYCRWIEQLSQRGVVGGCAPNLYCPLHAVSREQMAVFVLRTLDPALAPPACVAGAETFADVPASSPFCRWIEELARRGVVAGCAPGVYCPADPVTREQMAVFLSATFGLSLYEP